MNIADSGSASDSSLPPSISLPTPRSTVEFLNVEIDTSDNFSLLNYVSAVDLDHTNNKVSMRTEDMNPCYRAATDLDVLLDNYSRYASLYYTPTALT